MRVRLLGVRCRRSNKAGPGDDLPGCPKRFVTGASPAGVAGRDHPPLTRRPYNHKVVSVQTVIDHDRIFGALGDPTRRDIVRRAIDGEEGVAELASHYPMSFAAVQKHVAVLERAGLVHKHRIGRRKVVRTNLEGLRVARRLLDRYEDVWRERVERMTHLVSESPKEEDR
jgi:DNA-binding transcriptional ArsR family regulator